MPYERPYARYEEFAIFRSRPEILNFRRYFKGMKYRIEGIGKLVGEHSFSPYIGVMPWGSREMVLQIRLRVEVAARGHWPTYTAASHSKRGSVVNGKV